MFLTESENDDNEREPFICEELIGLNLRKIELESELRTVLSKEQNYLARLADGE